MNKFNNLNNFTNLNKYKIYLAKQRDGLDIKIFINLYWKKTIFFVIQINYLIFSINQKII